jgi:hypothetical protein
MGEILSLDRSESTPILRELVEESKVSRPLVPFGGVPVVFSA